MPAGPLSARKTSAHTASQREHVDPFMGPMTTSCEATGGCRTPVGTPTVRGRFWSGSTAGVNDGDATIPPRENILSACDLPCHTPFVDWPCRRRAAWREGEQD